MRARKTLPQSRGHDPANRRGESAQAFAEGHGAVAVISAEQFIAAVAAECDLHMPAGFAQKIMRRQGG